MADFTFQIDAHAIKADRAIQGVENRLSRLEGQAKRAGQGMTSAFDRVGKVLSGGLGIAGIGLGGRELISMADSMTNLRNRLRGLSSSTEEANAKFERLRGIAAATRSDLASTGEAYARIARSTQSLGLSSERTFALTETLGKAMAMSGASSSEAAAGMMQLGQAMSSGRLQGDELRSVLENIPIVAEALEKSLGVNRAGLRKMAEEGKITTAVIVEAFEKAKNDIDKGFGNTIPTIGQQFQALKNDIAVGAMTALASVGPVVKKMTADMEASVRAQREGIITGTTGYAELIKQGKNAAEIAGAFGDAQEAGMAAGRKAIEDFTRAGDIGVARYRQAIADFVASGSVEKIAAQTSAAANAMTTAFEKATTALAGFGSAASEFAERAGQKGLFGAFAEKVDPWFVAPDLPNKIAKAKKEISEYEQLLIDLEKPAKDAAERGNLLGQAFMNQAISAERYAEEIFKVREQLVELGKIQVNSVTSPLGTPTDPTAGIDTGKILAQHQQVAMWTDTAAARTQRWHEEMKKTEEEAQALGRAFAPLKNTLSEMLIKWDFDAEKLLDTLSQIALKLLEMAAVEALTGGGFAGGLLGAAHGGNFFAGPRALTGFAHGGGTDSQIVAFRKSPNETAHIQVMTPIQEKEAIQRSSGERRGGGPSQFFLMDDPRAIVSELGTREGQAEMVRMRRKFRRRD